MPETNISLGPGQMINPAPLTADHASWNCQRTCITSRADISVWGVGQLSLGMFHGKGVHVPQRFVNSCTCCLASLVARRKRCWVWRSSFCNWRSTGTCEQKNYRRQSVLTLVITVFKIWEGLRSPKKDHDTFKDHLGRGRESKIQLRATGTEHPLFFSNTSRLFNILSVRICCFSLTTSLAFTPEVLCFWLIEQHLRKTIGVAPVCETHTHAFTAN